MTNNYYNNRRLIREHDLDVEEEFHGRTSLNDIQTADQLYDRLEGVLPKESRMKIRNDGWIWIMVEEPNRPIKRIIVRPRGAGLYNTTIEVKGKGEFQLFGSGRIINKDGWTTIQYVLQQIAAINVDALAHIDTNYSKERAENEAAAQDAEWKEQNASVSHLQKLAGIKPLEAEETYPEFMASMAKETGESRSAYDLSAVKQNSSMTPRPSAYRELIKKTIDNGDEDLAPKQSKTPSHMSPLILKEGVKSRRLPDGTLMVYTPEGVQILKEEIIQPKSKWVWHNGRPVLTEGIERK